MHWETKNSCDSRFLWYLLFIEVVWHQVCNMSEVCLSAHNMSSSLKAEHRSIKFILTRPHGAWWRGWWVKTRETVLDRWHSEGICIWCATDSTEVCDAGNWHIQRKLSLATIWKWPLVGEVIKQPLGAIKKRDDEGVKGLQKERREKIRYNIHVIYSLRFSVTLGMGGREIFLTFNK